MDRTTKVMERYSTEIQCTDFTFLTTKNEQQQGQQPIQKQHSSNTQHTEAGSIAQDEDDDLPF